MMRVALLSFFLAAFSVLAQDPKPKPMGIEGIWEGPLKVGAIELRLAFKVTTTDGKLTAKLDSPDQGAKDIPISEVSFADGKAIFGEPKMLAKFTGTLNKDGTKLTGTFEQAGQKFPLSLTRVEKVSVLNRPQEPKKPYPYPSEEITFENPTAKIKLAGTLTIPQGDGPFPAVVLVTGSGPQDRDESLLGHKPFLVIADYLTRRGVAVLRYDDRGVAKSGGKFDGATSADFATDATAAVAFLKSRKEIDRKKIGVIGHSEGGLIAPMVAVADPSVAFIVLLAGPGISGEEVLLGQQAAITMAMGVSPAMQQIGSTILRKLIPIAKEPGTRDERKAKMKAASERIAAELTPEEKKLLGDAQGGSGQLDMLADPWMQFFLTFDPRPTLAKVKCPVLAVNGELDLQVLHKDNLLGIETALKDGGNARGTIKLFPGLNHLFQHCKTGVPSEYGKIDETFSPEVLEFIANWLIQQK